MKRPMSAAIFTLATFALSAGAVVARPLDAIQPYDSQAAAAYCVHTGGVVENRVPEFGTNGNNPLRLAGMQQFCQYTAHDKSRIHLTLFTLYAVRPTLAALAYYAKVKAGSCQGNPASCYCSLLGGSDQFGGANSSGGGWVLKGAIDEVLEACIFPDMSSIDSFGLFYHSANIVRGKDLSKVLRYHQT